MAIAMTVIELIAGEIFIVKMHVKLWDYTGNKFNYKGIICPLYSLIWAALGAVYYFFIHPYILDALNWLANNLAFSFFIGFFYGVFAIDLFYSLKIAEKIKTLRKRTIWSSDTKSSNGTSGKVQRREKRNTDLCFPWAQVQGLASI